MAGLGVVDIEPLVQAVVDSAKELAFTHAVYWQVIDNECKGAGVDCPGSAATPTARPMTLLSIAPTEK